MSGEKTIAQQRRMIAVPAGILRVGRDGPSTKIGAETILIGRNPACGLALDDPKVSAIHAEITVEEGSIWYHDRSSNGTYLNGSRAKVFELAQPTSFVVGSTKVEFVPGEPTEVMAPDGDDLHGLVGADPAMKRVMEQVQRLAQTDLSILILGETGTGKEMVARAIHAASPRAAKPFDVVDCGTIPSTLAESTLFGHERGSFTGAFKQQISPFERANLGTLFFDELGELPLETQPKLLRVLADQKVRSVGGSEYKRFDVRVVAATRRDLKAMVNADKFRSDLYFRMAHVTIDLPPLRERPADIPLLVRTFLEKMGHPEAFDLVSDESLEYAVENHTWPGNVRELSNCVKVAFTVAERGSVIDLRKGIISLADKAEAADWSWSAHEKWYFERLYRHCSGNKSAMARFAGLKRDTVAEKIRIYGIGTKNEDEE